MRSWPGPVRLSPQQLIDCSSKKGNKRCRGGTVQNALAYAQSNGVQLDAAYPYVAKASLVITVCTVNGEVNKSSKKTQRGFSADICQLIFQTR